MLQLNPHWMLLGLLACTTLADPHVQRLLDEPDAGTYRDLLVAYGPPEVRHLDLLGEATRSSDPERRLRAASLLQVMPTELTSALLQPLTQDPDDRVWAIARQHPDAASWPHDPARARKAFEHIDPAVRRIALRLLPELGPRALLDPSPSVRGKALAILRIRTPTWTEAEAADLLRSCPADVLAVLPGLVEGQHPQLAYTTLTPRLTTLSAQARREVLRQLDIASTRALAPWVISLTHSVSDDSLLDLVALDKAAKATLPEVPARCAALRAQNDGDDLISRGRRHRVDRLCP